MPVKTIAIAVIVFGILIVYAGCLLFVFLYSMAQAHLVYHYLRGQEKVRNSFSTLTIAELPKITVQLPIFNEQYVVNRLIDTICKFDYPIDKLQIQVLDDSTDETVALIASKVTEWQAKGIDIVHVRRAQRKGYKAGALKEGLREAKGDFIALFDADFMPEANFLLKTIPYFNHKDTGMVQARWQHLNSQYSWLTKLQAFGLNAHFTIEQNGRNKGRFFINFNGTAGIWRKACILDSGNWQSDTLTEDLDLSYRAQLKGWKFVYLEHLGAPAELPPAMSALKTQQYRWSKGGAEVARKQLISVWTSSQPILVKGHATFHLLNSSIFICVLFSSILSVPLLFIQQSYPEYKPPLLLDVLCLSSFFILGGMYWVAARKANMPKPATFLNFLYTFIYFLSVMMGLSFHNSIAVIEGFSGRQSPFVRTPKFNLFNDSNAFKNNTYLSRKMTLINGTEACLAFFFFFACFMDVKLSAFTLLPFHLMLCFGFSMVFYGSIFPLKRSNQQATADHNKQIFHKASKICP